MRKELSFVKLLDSWYIDLPEFSHILSIPDCLLINPFNRFIENITDDRHVRLVASTEAGEEYNILFTYLGDQDDKEVGMYEVQIINVDEVEYTGIIFMPTCIVNIFDSYPEKLYLCVF